MAGKPEKGFKIEYAKSGRAGCKGCGQKIDQGGLRLGKMIPSPHFDGYVPLWHHVPCYFRKKKVDIKDGVADIEGFMDIQFDDQKMIKDLLSGKAAVEPVPIKAKHKGGAAGASPKKAGEFAVGDYVVEVAKSGRSKCRECAEKIEQGELRHHVKCVDVAKSGVSDAKDITGFDDLSATDQQILRDKFGGGGASSSSKKRAMEDAKPAPATTKKKGKAAAAAVIKLDDSDDEVSLLALPLKKEEDKSKGKEAKTEGKAAAPQNEEMSKGEKAMKAHSDKLFKIRSSLAKESSSLLKQVLSHNDVDSTGGEVTLQARLADIMLHGVPSMCPQCGNGRLRYEDGKYKCGADVDEYSRCQWISSEAERETFKMPPAICGNGYLESFKFVKTAFPEALKREVAAVDEVVKEKKLERQKTLERLESAEATARAAKKALEEAPNPSTCLEGMVFALHFTKTEPLDKAALADKISAHGGKCVGSMTQKVTHVLATTGGAANGGAPMKEAHKRGLPVVKVGFLDACIAEGRRISEKDFLLAGEAKVEEAGGRKRKAEAEGSKTVKIMVKGKGAVDVDSGMADNAHVLEVGSSVYSATLNSTDLATDTNSYYVLQVIQTDTGKKTYLFKKWGRIGTKQGGNRLQQMPQSEAVEEFELSFHDKTGNLWHDRTPDRFQKRPGKFSVMELGIAADDLQHKDKAAMMHKASELPPSVASFVSLITDIQMMKRTMMEMEIDLDKMPLGALSRAQIEKGYKILSDLSLVLQDDPEASALGLGRSSSDQATKQQRILSFSNQFYTIVPQNFGSHGMSDKHLIDSMEKLLKKRELVETLLEMEIAVSLSKEDSGSDANPIDESYKKLKADIKPVDKTAPEFKLVEKYLQNTHAKTHSSYTLKLIELFTVEREGEKERYAKHKDNHNRQLLFHGSRLTNWMGILSQGLRIAPPEAPVTGYMFGKGVYFADMSSKSANYCCAKPGNSEGVMLLSEVALGDMHELRAASEKLPKGKPDEKMSVKGCGKIYADPAGAEKLDDGVLVPCGKALDNSLHFKSSLLYNEFIVYDTSQIKSRYLLRVKFNFK